MPSLRELQDAFRFSLLGAEDEAAAAYVLDDGLAPERRLAVHRNAFDSNLANALRLSYPAVHKLVGAEFFEGAARIYAHEHPPRAAWLDGYGAEFPDFLAAFAPAASLAYLADVARLEWAVNCALHAPDAEPLDARRLAAIDPALHEHVRFIAHPAVSLVHANHPVDIIWRAVLSGDDASLAAVDLAAGPARLIVERGAEGIAVERLDEHAWRVSAALFAGTPLGLALAAADDPNSAVDDRAAATVLAQHLAHGRFVAFRLWELAIDAPTPGFCA
jgi:hypothetical protein